jgi:hypothetical protein
VDQTISFIDPGDAGETTTLAARLLGRFFTWTDGRQVHIRRSSPNLSGDFMRIEKHDKSYIVELEDGSRWRIWPGDIAMTLQWLPSTELQVVAIDDEFCTHALIDQADGSRVGVIKADADWPAEQVRRFLKQG